MHQNNKAIQEWTVRCNRCGKIHDVVYQYNKKLAERYAYLHSFFVKRDLQELIEKDDEWEFEDDGVLCPDCNPNAKKDVKKSEKEKQKKVELLDLKIKLRDALLTKKNLTLQERHIYSMLEDDKGVARKMRRRYLFPFKRRV